MRLSLGSNIISLQAQRRLNESTAALSSVYERLSSGQRINRASDDAAGLSVSATLGAKSRVLGRANQNIGDAQSLLTIADSTFGEISNILGRIGELAEQAANGSYSSGQRRNMNSEFRQLQLELERISDSTSFNGLNLLGGTQSTRAATTIHSSGASLTVGDVSSDGRFQVSIDDKRFQIRDRDTGEVRTVLGNLGDTVHIIGVTDSGDAIFSQQLNSGSLDIFRYSYSDRTTTQLVSSTPGSSETQATISSDGSTLVFSTDGDVYQDGVSGLNPTSGTPGVFNIYTLDLASGMIRNLFTTSNSILSLKISANGEFVGFADQTSDNIELFSTITRQQTTFSTGASNGRMIGIGNDGRALFLSKSNFTGGNANGAYQIFELSAATSAVRQITDASYEYNFDPSNSFGLSADGRHISFLSSSYYGPGSTNPSAAFQLYQIDTIQGGIRQMTQYTAANGPLDDISGVDYRISRDGSTIIGAGSNPNTILEIDTTLSATSFNFEVGFGALGSIDASIGSLLGTVRGLGAFELSNIQSARAILHRNSKNIDALAGARGIIGAALSRVGIAQSLVQGQRTEVDAANGRIKDADIASESAHLIRLQISQQAASSVLAQANQQPALAIRLLN